MMKNIFTNNFLFKGLILILTILGVEASAQTWDQIIPPAGTFVTGEEATFQYEASGFDAGTTFILYLDEDNDGLDESDVLATSTTQDALTDLDFTWPDIGDDVAPLRLGAYDGTTFIVEETQIEGFELVRAGSDAGDNTYSIVFDRAGVRRALTPAYDTTVPEKFTLFVELTDNGGLDATNPLIVQYSTDGGSSFTNMVNTDGDTELFGFGNTVFSYEVPVDNANTRFRVVQKDANALSSGSKTWDLDDMFIEVGDSYTLLTPGYGYNSFETVTYSSLSVIDIQDDGAVSISGGTAYPGDEVTLVATLPDVEFPALDFVGVLVGPSGEIMLLENQNDNPDNVTKEVEVTGDIPAGVEYDVVDFYVLAYPSTEAEAIIGLDESYTFSDVDDFEVSGGDTNGAKLIFDETGERSVLTPAYDIESEANGVLTFDLKRKNSLVSPAGTEVVVEYTTDGTTFTAIDDAEFSLNSFSASSFTEVEAVLPAGVVSATTRFRIRQLSNNGDNLDAWEIDNLTIESGSNIVSYYNYNSDDLTVLRPAIALDPLTIPDDLVYPMTALTLDYTIDEGIFPANTTARLMVNRSGDPDFDIILEEIADVTTGTISFQAPALEAGDYTLYLDANGEQYYSVSLPIYDLGLAIDEVTSTEAIDVDGSDFVYPGSPITITYSMTGTPGAGAELIVSVFDDNLDEDNDGPDDDEFVVIGSTTTFDGSVTATLPTGVDYDPAQVRLSVGSTGTFSNNASEMQLFNDDFYSSTFPTTLVESAEGVEDFSQPDAFTSSGVRSATSVPFDFTYGGTLDLSLYTEANFFSSFDVRLEGSTDGETWEELEMLTFVGLNDIESFSLSVPNSLWSESFQFRIIYNEDGESAYRENVVKFWDAEVTSPQYMDVVLDDELFNLLIPSIDVENLASTNLVIGQESTVNFNAQGFPAGTSFAVVVYQNEFFHIAGETSAAEATNVTATMPLVIPLDELNPSDPYELTIVPFAKENASDTYREGETIVIDEEDEFELVEGADFPTGNYSVLDFDNVGSRSATTVSFDLSEAESATLTFDFNTYYGYGSFDISDNKNVVPRLQIKNASGAFVEVPVYELADGEEQIYDDGLIYLQEAGLQVEIPSEFLTGDVQFRWVQLLNLGNNESRWSIDDIELEINSGNAIPDNLYSNSNNPIIIDLGAPDLSLYEWAQSDLDDPVFNGEAFDYDWDKVEGADPVDFPAGTTFDFYLYDGSGNVVLDPETNMPFALASTTNLGTAQASVPFYVTNGSYDVRLAASLDIEGETYYFVGDADGSTSTVGSLDIFLRVLELSYTGDENATIYAGNDITFSIISENDETNSADLSGLFANLIADYGGDDYLLAAPQGLDDITVMLPPFMQGNIDFRVELSEDAALGVVGEVLDNNALSNLENGIDGLVNFINGREYAFIDNQGTGSLTDDEFLGGEIQLQSPSGRRMITSRDFETGELTDANLLSFDLTFNQLPEDLTDDQYFVLEYSIDGGTTYSELSSYPSETAEETLVAETYMIDLTDEMKQNDVRFRWRQEETKGTISLDNVLFVFGEVLPFDYVSQDLDISEQALLISSVGSEFACPGDPVTLNYEIRGRFGADNIVEVLYRPATINSNYLIDGYEFAISEGSGTVEINMAEVEGSSDSNEKVKFYLRADDDTFEADGNDYMVSGPYMEQNVEFVAPIDLDADFSVSEPLACDPEDVIVTINSPQDYFTYEIISNDLVVASLTYDPEVGEDKINIGSISASTELGLIVTSNTSDGSACNTVTVDYTEEVNILADYQLYKLSTVSSNYRAVVSGETANICEGSSAVVQLRVYRELSGGSLSLINTSDVEWFRNDLSTPLPTPADGNLGDDTGEITQSGSYFARVRDGACTYLTESIDITVISQPDKPAITVSSGSLKTCLGEEVVLEAPEGFQYYSWSNGAQTRVVTLDDFSGNISVSVSNLPFGTGCGSATSNAVLIERLYLPEFSIGKTTSITSSRIGNGDAISRCDDFTVRFFEDNSYGNSGEIEVIKDGESYGWTTSDSYTLDESGVYSFNWMNGDLDLDCSVASVEFTLTIEEAPTEIPELTSTGELTFCEGEGFVLLTAPSGFSKYNWLRDGSVISDNQDGFDATSNTLAVYDEGDYAVQVGNMASCYGPTSNVIEVITRDLPSEIYNSWFTQTGTSCGEGGVEFTISSGVDRSYSYQLINAETGEASGDPVTGSLNGNTVLVSGPIDVPTQFYIEVSYADGSGCVNSVETSTRTGYVNNVVLELDGTTLNAIISEYYDVLEIRWYRNGVMLRNRLGDDQITVTDAAEYRIEVEFEGGCMISSNTIMESEEDPGSREAPTNRIAATAFPNPSDAIVNVDLDGNNLGEYELTLMTMSGQVLIFEKANKDAVEFSHQLEISGLDPGIYNLQITKGNETKNMRILKR